MSASALETSGASDHGGRTGHIDAIDLARLLTIGLVISVHVISLTPSATTAPIGAFVVVFHVSREVFFLITAFVLTYTYGSRRLELARFWRRRYLYVVVPYVAWTAIYFAADHQHLDPISRLIRAFGHDLVTGDARYHLYFLLVSMQIYLVFPLLRRLLQATTRHHVALVVAAVIYQFGISTTIQLHASPGGPLTWWLHNPNALLPSYLGYVVGGGVAACHFDRLASWTASHPRVVVPAVGSGIAAGVGAYLAQLEVAGDAPLRASAVFQPVVVLESAAVAWCFLAIGLWWVERGMAQRRIVATGADASFGIFLSHPLVLQGLLALGAMTGVLAYVRALPAAAQIPLMLGVVVPVVYLLAALISVLARSTPLSLVLTGRSLSARAPMSVSRAKPRGEDRDPAPQSSDHQGRVVGAPA